MIGVMGSRINIVKVKIIKYGSSKLFLLVLVWWIVFMSINFVCVVRIIVNGFRIKNWKNYS